MVAPVAPRSILNIQQAGLVAPSVIHKYYRRTGNRQKRPYNLPLSASSVFAEITSYSRQSSNYTTNVPSMGPLSDSDIGPGLTEAYNKAYDRFKAETRNQAGAELGTNLAERKQAMSMMTSRLIQLGKFTRQVRRFDFRGATATLGLSKRPKGLKRNAKAFSSNWLEYHFGWSPLIGDIHGAMKTLAEGIPPFRCRGSATVKRLSFKDDKWTDYGWLVASYKEWLDTSVKVQLQADVVVTNHNLWLLNQLGLVNLATLAWELVPFSFVVDWVGNVGSFLSSYTDFVGLDIQLPCKTVFVRRFGKRHDWNVYGHQLSTNQVIQMNRTPGKFPGPSLQFIAPRGLSPTRGLTAATLLIQLMR